MFKPGDVVIGSFVTENGVIRHYSVVLTGNAEGAVLVYTTSEKCHPKDKYRFSDADRRLANWSKPCRWDASTISLVPNEQIEKTGTVTRETFVAITNAFTRAIQEKTVTAMTLTKEGDIVSA